MYTSVEQQINKLKSQNLIIEDKEYAAEILQQYGYFNMIKGYREPYILTDGNDISYRSNVTFEQITSLYVLDKNLRAGVLASMLDLEEYLKASVADVIANSFGVHQDSYLKFSNYRDKKRRRYEFTLSGILKTMKKSLDTDKNPVLHYRTNHGIIPPWVLFKNIYFSTIVNFINLLKPNEKQALINRLYDTTSLKIPIENLQRIMMDTLFLCLEYRNLAAHGGRIYNYDCNSNVDYSNFKKIIVPAPKGLNQLLFLLSLLKYNKPQIYLFDSLNYEVNRHCNLYPEDSTYLAQIFNMDIVPQEMAWITSKGNKYHTSPDCCKLTHINSIPLTEAINNGYKPCRKCKK